MQTMPVDMLDEIRSTSEYWGGLMGLRQQGGPLETMEEIIKQEDEDEMGLGDFEFANETDVPPHWLDYKQ